MESYLEKLVSFYSVTDDQQAVCRLLDYTEAFFEERGLKVTRYEFDGVNSLVASVFDTKTPKLMLQGHVDVVPGANQPFQRVEGIVKGRGVFDMLFGVAAFMQLVDELDPVKNGNDIAIMLVGDEEHGGMSGARLLLEREGYKPALCILPDAGNGFGSMSIAAKGTFHPYIRINGRSHHGSRPWEGDGAAGKLVRFITEMEQLFDPSDQQNSTMTVAMVQSGSASNQGPATAEAKLDIRYKDKTDLDRIKETFYALLNKYNGEVIDLLIGSDFQLDLQDERIVMFVDMYKQATGTDISFIKAHGSSDARFFAERGIPVIMFRPDGGGAHGDDEWLSLESFDAFYGLLRGYVQVLLSA